MELDPNSTKTTRTNLDNSPVDFFIINETVMSKLCILGEETEPCFEGADIKAPRIQFSFEDDFKNQLYNMMNEIREFMLKGGKEEMAEENKVILENEGKIDESVENNFENNTEEEKCPECGKPVTECECDKEALEHAKKKDEEKEEEKKTEEEPKEDEGSKAEEPPVEEDEEEKKKKAKEKYNLVEASEYEELQRQYNELNENYEALTSENTSLKEFKVAAERKDKQAMINSFTMLSDSDKADVVENIDTYSVDEIEAKLAVICVRNKVSFELETETKNETVVSFNLHETQEEDSMPAWVKAVKAVKDSENL